MIETEESLSMMKRQNGVCILLLAIAILGCIKLTALAQNQRSKDAGTSYYGDCGAANAGGQNSTNYYSKGNPCAYIYSVPAERLPQLLQDNNSCTMYSRTQVNCSQPVRGNYGQIQLDRRDGAGAGGGKNPGSSPELSYPPVPPSAITPAQKADAEQMWQRSDMLIKRNDYRDAIPLLLQAGRLGHPKAQATLGIAYQNGNGVRRDDMAAARWYSLAAAQGHRAAQYALAGMYEEGEGGLPKNVAKARELYLLSANQGFDKAQLEVGIAYEVGDGVPRSRERAINMLRASGLGNNIASILAEPGTPARFANIDALGAYLKKLRDIENARQNAAINAATRGSDSGECDLGCTMRRLQAAHEFEVWQHQAGVGTGGERRNY
jgi:TPR repeat protein